MAPASRRVLVLAPVLAIAAAACKPSGGGSTAAGSDGAAASATVAAATASSAAAPAAPVTWTGTYKSTAGTIYVPDGGEWANTKWRGDPGTDGVGDGTLTIVAAPNGDVTGTIDGALGPGTVAGRLDGDALSATVRAKTFTGTLTATKASTGAVEGSLHAASTYDAHLLRDATFSLAKKP